MTVDDLGLLLSFAFSVDKVEKLVLGIATRRIEYRIYYLGKH